MANTEPPGNGRRPFNVSRLVGAMRRLIPAPGIIGKVVLIGLLVLLLQIPLAMVQDLIREREGRYHAAVSEIGSAWGRPQRVIGPILAVPYLKSDTHNWSGTRSQRHEAYFLPERLGITARLAPEVRYRGLFEATLYKATLKIDGHFVPPNLDSWKPSKVIWRDAYIMFGVADPRSIPSDVTLGWRDRQLILEPATLGHVTKSMANGLRAKDLQLGNHSSGENIPFSLGLQLNGSDGLNFVPLGKRTHVAVDAPWPAPSFTGAFLPEKRTITADRFSASWDISYFGRGYGQQWGSAGPKGLNDSAIARSQFGVKLIQPLNAYRQVERSAKYGNLFLVLTFLVYFLIAVTSGLRIHAVQYGLVGLSLCLFYLLLLSFSETLGFELAYAVSTAGVVGQTSLYSLSITSQRRSTALFGSLLLSLYGFLYIVLRLESYALLSGSVALFAALSAMMYLTRNIRWSRDGETATP